MGHDLLTVSRHNFDTGSVERLAAQLSERLNINITYGINSVPFEVTRLVYPDCEYDGFYELGSVIRHQGEPCWLLWREHGGDLELYHQMGEAMVDLPIFNERGMIGDGSYYLNSAKEFRHNPSYTLMHPDDEHCDICIFKESAVIDLFYFCRYWCFFNSVTIVEEQSVLRNDHLEEFRTAQMAVALLLGSDRVYHFNDQKGPVHVFDDVTSRTWTEIIAHVEEKAGPNLWTVADVLNTKRDTAEGIVLVDDFRDLDRERAKRFLPDLRRLKGDLDWKRA